MTGSLSNRAAALVLAAAAGTMLPSLASAGTVAFEDFEAGATGWSNNQTDSAPAFTRFLGRHSIIPGAAGTVFKTFALSGNQTQATISFDFYEIDSWDGELFMVFVDNQFPMTVGSFWTQPDYVIADRPAVGVVQITLPGSNLGFGAWGDQIWRYTFTYNTTGTSLKVGFGSTLDQHFSDESWGVDNLRITDNAGAVVPLPPAAWAGLTLFGVTAAGQWRRKRLAVD